MTPAPGRDGVPRGGAAALAGVGALAVWSALWRLDRSDWKLDEDAYAQAGWYLVHDGVDPNRGHPPLAKLLFGAAQVAFGRDLTSVRAVAALGFLLSVAVLFLVGRRIGGWWTGVVAAGLFALLPRTMVVGGWTVGDVRIDRYALLEAVSGPLILGAVAAGWRWITGGGRRWAVASGALVGLAGAAKLNSLVVLVAVLAVGVALGWGRRALAEEASALFGAALLGFLVPFLVFGRAAGSHISEVLRFPGERAEQGHLLVLGRDVYDRSPWWAHLRYQWDADGWLLVVCVVTALVLAATVSPRRRPAVVYLLAVTGALVASAMASPVALPHYRAAWTAPLLLLVAVALVDHLEPRAGPVLRPAAVTDDRSQPQNGGQSLRRFGESLLRPAVVTGDRSQPQNRTRLGGVVAGVVLVVLVGCGVAGAAGLATLGEGDYHRMARQARADGVAPTKVLVYGEAVAPYFPGAYDSLAPFDDGATPAQLVVLDPSLTDAVDGATVERWRNWARGWGLAPHRIGRLEAWWAP
ncbi:MAG: hypothetical protein KF703_03745 [Actinobacteria bacterium]|nr:hypothetical protein [Actinomycetota bacterium]